MSNEYIENVIKSIDNEKNENIMQLTNAKIKEQKNNYKILKKNSRSKTKIVILLGIFNKPLIFYIYLDLKYPTETMLHKIKKFSSINFKYVEIWKKLLQKLKNVNVLIS